MANNLTGDYDAVFQISTQQVNGILATMHQRRIDPTASPSFPHSIRFQVGDLPPILQPWNKNFGDFVSDLEKHLHQTVGINENVTPVYYTKSLPEVSRLYEKAFAGLDLARVTLPSSARPLGLAYVQVSTPTITLRGGATNQIMVHLNVRAHYFPDQGAGSLPEPIHGEVQANYFVQTKWKVGKKYVHVSAPAQDDQIQFYPAAGINLSTAEINSLADQIRHALRTDFIPSDVDINDLPASEFIALGSGAGQAIALPMQLTDPYPSGSIGSITNHLLGGFEFAIAVSKDYIQSQFASVIQGMKDYVGGITITVDAVIASTVYHASLSGVALTWKAGAIDLSGHVDLKTRSIAPNLSFDFTQTITLALDVPSQTVKVVPVGDPVISNASALVPKGEVAAGIKNGRDNALSKLSLQVVNDVRNQMISSLRRFDNHADVRYATIEVTPDGMVLRGAIGPSGTGWRLDPVVHFESTSDGKSFTAFKSWIPGGGIDVFEWTWPEGAAWFSNVSHFDDPHRFIFPKPDGITQSSQICLKIYGTRITADGASENVVAGETCKPSWSEPVLVIPPWMLQIWIPIWRPPDDIRPQDALEISIAGYINAAGPSRDPGRLVSNTLVYFAAARLAEPLEQLGQVMSQSRRQDKSLLLILVLPSGTFRQSRREVEAQIGTMTARFAGHLIITEDFQGGWSKAFSARETPAAFFLNARREFVWKHAGEIDARAFVAAIEEHMTPAPAPQTEVMQLNVQPGDRAPDVLVENVQGESTALSRFRGQRVILNFFQAWAKPCLLELQNLQRLHDSGGADTPVILGISADQDRTALDQVQKENNLSFPLIHDSEQRIASLFAIQCWPTTVSISREGIVDRVQFGVSHENRETVTKEESRGPDKRA
jgi:peroxiredoxin